MRLSEAILEGVKKDGYQTFGTYFDRDEMGNIVGCCALGAALIAIGMPDACVSSHFRQNALWSNSISCPECDEMTVVPGAMVPHLNDRHRWTREAIAVWLDRLGL
jgi:uncharacterized protein YaiE (UPF0345 family)